MNEISGIESGDTSTGLPGLGEAGAPTFVTSTGPLPPKGRPGVRTTHDLRAGWFWAIALIGGGFAFYAAIAAFTVRSETTPHEALGTILICVGLGLVWIPAWGSIAETIKMNDVRRRMTRAILVDGRVDDFTPNRLCQRSMPLVSFLRPGPYPESYAPARLGRLRGAPRFDGDIGDIVGVRYDPEEIIWVAIDRAEFQLDEALSRARFWSAILVLIGILLVSCGIVLVA